MTDSIDDLKTEVEILRAKLAAVRQENALLNEKLTAALDGTGLCIWQGEPQTGKLTVFNLQDFDRGEMAPHFDLWLAKLHPEDKQVALKSYSEHLAGNTPFYEAEYRTVRPDGGLTWLWDRGRVIERDQAGRPLRIMGAHVDVTRRKEYERQLSELAHLDALTSLANRRRLSERLHHETERAKRYGNGFVLAMLDVDRFKQFNDLHGHELGDRILQEVALAMSSELRECDLCGRWGGEEFLVILPDTTTADAQVVLSRVHTAIAERYIESDGEALRVTVSVGLAEYRSTESYADTLRRADKALLSAKRAGRNRMLCAGA